MHQCTLSEFPLPENVSFDPDTTLVISVLGQPDSFTFTRVTDSVDDSVTGDANCGAVTYTLYEEAGDVDTVVTNNKYLTYDFDDATTITITAESDEIDDEDDIANYEAKVYYVEAKLETYPDVTQNY